MVFRRRYRRRRFNGRKRLYRRSLYRARRRYRRRPAFRRRSYRKLWTRKNQVGVRAMKYFDTGIKWKSGGCHMLQAHSTPLMQATTSRYNNNFYVNNAFSYWANDVCAAGHEIYPTGMLDRSLHYKMYRVNGGKMKWKIHNQMDFGVMLYWKWCRVNANAGLDEYSEFTKYESNDLDHGHGVSKRWIPPKRVDNDETEHPSVTKIVARFRTRDLLKGTGSSFNDQWRLFSYPNETWNTAANDCVAVKNSAGNHNHCSIMLAFSYVTPYSPAATLTQKWTRENFSSDRLMFHEWHMRWYCSYRSPKEHEPNTTTSDYTHYTGTEAHDPSHFDEYVE